MSKNIKHSNKGITLIALSITIIVLCILASITLAALSSDNGLIIKAQEAKNATIGSDLRENSMIKNVLGYANTLKGNNTGGTIPDGGNNIIGGGEHIHSYDSGVITKQPTCTEAGITTYTCSCGASYTQDIPAATGHDYESVVTKAATSTEDGIMTHTCKNCGDTYTTTIPKTGTTHTCSFTEKNTALTYRKSTATCQTPATYYYSCTCGAKGTTTFTYGSVADHVYTYQSTSSNLLRDEATCTEDATYYYECKWCYAYTTSDWWTDTGSALGHNWGNWVVTTPATCTSNGVQTRTCGRCGMTETNSIPASGAHNWNSSTGKCDNCGMSCEHDWMFEGSAVLDNYRHSYGEYCEICYMSKNVTEAHNYNSNGVCQGPHCSHQCTHQDWTKDSSGYGVCGACGYKCAHPYQEYVYSQYNSAQHKVVLKCPTCSVEKAAAVPYQSHRNWESNGSSCKCSDCGYTTSAHNWVYEEEEESYCSRCGEVCTHTSVKHYYVTAIPDSDAATHHSHYWVCDTCDYSYTLPSHEAHTFNSSGVCTLCKYDKNKDYSQGGPVDGT